MLVSPSPLCFPCKNKKELTMFIQKTKQCVFFEHHYKFTLNTIIYLQFVGECGTVFLL